MANIYWLYKNFLEKATRLKDQLGGRSGYSGTVNLYDFNLETFHTPAGYTISRILVDVGSSVYCDSVVVIHSNTMEGTGNIKIYAGTQYPNWKFLGTLEPKHIVDNDYGTSAIFFTGTTMQYFGIETYGRSGGTVEVHEIFLGKRLELTYNPIYPAREAIHRAVTVGETPKGIRHAYHNFDRKSWALNYEGLDDTDKGDIETMTDYCGGSYKPLWYCQDPNTPAETHFVRFASNRFTYSEIVSGVWHVMVPLEQEL